MEYRMNSRPMTVDEYSRLPESDGVDELHAGFVVSEPRPLPRHGRIQTELAARLHACTRPRKIGVVLTDTGFLLAKDPDTVRAPDVAFVRRERVAGAGVESEVSVVTEHEVGDRIAAEYRVADDGRVVEGGLGAAIVE